MDVRGELSFCAVFIYKGAAVYIRTIELHVNWSVNFGEWIEVNLIHFSRVLS